MILVDTSAWVEYDRATGSSIDQRLTQLISAESPIAVTEPVIMEVVAGARNPQRLRTSRSRSTTRDSTCAYRAIVLREQGL